MIMIDHSNILGMLLEVRFTCIPVTTETYPTMAECDRWGSHVPDSLNRHKCMASSNPKAEMIQTSVAVLLLHMP